MRDGDYVIGDNPGHGRIISTTEVWAGLTDARGFTTGEMVDIGTALVKWTDGAHGRYPRSELRVVEFRPQPAVFPQHEGFCPMRRPVYLPRDRHELAVAAAWFVAVAALYAFVLAVHAGLIPTP